MHNPRAWTRRPAHKLAHAASSTRVRAPRPACTTRASHRQSTSPTECRIALHDLYMYNPLRHAPARPIDIDLRTRAHTHLTALHDHRPMLTRVLEPPVHEPCVSTRVHKISAHADRASAPRRRALRGSRLHEPRPTSTRVHDSCNSNKC